MLKTYGFVAAGVWIVGGLALTLAALSRYIFDPDAQYRDGLTRREMFGHRLAASWLWPFYLFSKSGRQMLLYIVSDEEGISE